MNLHLTIYLLEINPSAHVHGELEVRELLCGSSCSSLDLFPPTWQIIYVSHHELIISSVYFFFFPVLG